MHKLLPALPRTFNRYALVWIFITLCALVNYPVWAKPVASPLEGRWDITIDVAGKPVASWLEVTHSGTRTLVGRFLGLSGSARPVSEVHVKDNTFRFTIPPQWEKGDGNLSVEGTLENDKLSGSLTIPDGNTYRWEGVRAPILRRKSPPVWGKPIQLTQGNSLSGWHGSVPNHQWTIQDGILKSEQSGANLITDQKFTDFKLHVEFRIPKGSNSGVYLRGRYEVQVADGFGLEPAVDQLGAVYGFLSPSEMVAKPAGEWQSFDIVLIGRMITLDVNGKRVITNQEIPGVTGRALDSREAEPGPIYVQGDHGPVEYRNIVITPAK